MNNENESMLQELHEARMFRRVSQLVEQPFGDISRRIFEHALALEVLSYINPKAAADYAKEILKYQDFAGFRAQAVDMYNLIVVVLRKERFKDKMDIPDDIVIPELRLKRWLRAIAAGRPDHVDFKAFIMILQNRLQVSSASRSTEMLQLRRMVVDWERASPDERKQTIGRLAYYMREMHGPVSDLVVALIGVASSKGLNL